MSERQHFGGPTSATVDYVSEPDLKRQRLAGRACDGCRLAKRKCDATEFPNQACWHCRSTGSECTFVDNGRIRRTTPKGYIEDLENRCKLLEQLVFRLAPHLNLEAEVGPKFDQDTWASVKAKPRARANGPRKATKAPLPASVFLNRSSVTVGSPGSDLRPAGGPLSTETARAHDLTSLVEDLEHSMRRMAIGPEVPRYNGRFTSLVTIRTAIWLKEQAEKKVMPELSGFPLKMDLSKLPIRRWYWMPCPWEFLSYNLPPPSQFRYPPADLAASLIELCFTKALVMFPILHRPSFERDAAAGLHMKDHNFAKIYLLVCALGSRYSDDSRVVLKAPLEEGQEPEIQWRSAGWMFFSQAMSTNRPVLQPAELHDLQLAALSALYLEGSSSPHATSWLMVGAGLRAAQDVGVHRQQYYIPARHFANQMWKRAFWCLIVMERAFCTAIGRSTAILDEEIDVGFPLEVDDEYYDEASHQWKQPPGKPSRLTAFIQYIKLTRIYAQTSRRVYGMARDHTAESVSQSVAELDRSLVNWMGALPRHLKWDPSAPDVVHLEQSAILQLLYHHTRIIIYQPNPFLSGPTYLDQPMSTTACIEAAKSIASILDVRQARGCPAQSVNNSIAFITGLVSLVTIWDAQRRQPDVEVGMQIDLVRSCLRTLKTAERRFHVAGALNDALTKLGSGLIPELQEIVRGLSTGRKRPRVESTSGDPLPVAGLGVAQSSGRVSPVATQKVPTGPHPEHIYPPQARSALTSAALITCSTDGEGSSTSKPGTGPTSLHNALSDGWEREADSLANSPNLHHYRLGGSRYQPTDTGLQGLFGPDGSDQGTDSSATSLFAFSNQEWPNWFNDLVFCGAEHNPTPNVP